MSERFQEPWRITTGAEPWDLTILDADGYAVMTTNNRVCAEGSPEQYRRAVACVNACKGIPTSTLNQVSVTPQQDPAPAPEAAEPFNAAVAVETIARIKAERDEAREALAAERKVLQALRSTMQASVAGCCGDGAGERFCESYGCGTLKRYIETIDAALAAAPGVPASGGEGGGE